MPALARDSLRILHIDDDRDFAQLSARALKQAGFKQPITHCLDGLRALDYFSRIDQESAPHVILLDLHMPSMNGLEVLHWLRQNYRERNIPIYLLTSSDDPAHRRQAAADGVTEYLLKSPLAAKLIEKLDALIAWLNRVESPAAAEEEATQPELSPRQRGSFFKN
jgi:CheY-like chemotaxis protein